MSKPALLSTGPMMPLISDQLEAAFDVHWMHKEGDLEAMHEVADIFQMLPSARVSGCRAMLRVAPSSGAPGASART